MEISRGPWLLAKVNPRFQKRLKGDLGTAGQLCEEGLGHPGRQRLEHKPAVCFGSRGNQKGQQWGLDTNSSVARKLGGGKQSVCQLLFATLLNAFKCWVRFLSFPHLPLGKKWLIRRTHSTGLSGWPWGWSTSWEVVQWAGLIWSVGGMIFMVQDLATASTITFMRLSRKQSQAVRSGGSQEGERQWA